MPARPPTDAPTAVVFDLGGVLIDWDPRHLYRQLFTAETEMERFLRDVVSPAWNLEHDRGRSFADGVALLTLEHPDRAGLIAAFHERWPEMLGDPIQPTVDLLAELHDGGVRLLALTNWSAETWPIGLARFGFLAWFEAIVVSGVERLVKPDPAIFRILVDRHGVDPSRTVFIDDLATNVDAAAALGFRAIRFTDAASLREALRSAGVELGLAPRVRSRVRPAGRPRR